MSEWPKTIYKYLHSDDDGDYDLAQSLGIKEDRREYFRPCYEVKFTIEVHEDGTTYATHFDDIELKEKVAV